MTLLNQKFNLIRLFALLIKFTGEHSCHYFTYLDINNNTTNGYTGHSEDMCQTRAAYVEDEHISVGVSR